jgi:hypothetical protein
MADLRLRRGFRVALLAPALALCWLANAYASPRPPRCTDPPVSVTFVAPASATAAIENDNPATAYQNGVDGVTAVIHYNSSCAGSHDMTLELGGSSRTLKVNIPPPIPGSIIDGGPAAAGVFTTKAFFNVHNVLAYPMSPVPTVFYTKVTAQLNGVNKQSPSYYLAYWPHNGTCPGPEPCAPLNESVNPLNNMPGEAAWAKVTYTPAAGGSPDSWVVEGDLTTNEPGPDFPVQRGTLFLKTKNGTWPHYGQYSLPFKMIITALAPLPQP